MTDSFRLWWRRSRHVSLAAHLFRAISQISNHGIAFDSFPVRGLLEQILPSLDHEFDPFRLFVGNRLAGQRPHSLENPDVLCGREQGVLKRMTRSDLDPSAKPERASRKEGKRQQAGSNRSFHTHLGTGRPHFGKSPVARPVMHRSC
jgi:hypothetical protein